MIKMLLSEKSENARGTLHHIVSLFHFKTFNNTAKDYFLNLWDFITVRRRSVPQSCHQSRVFNLINIHSLSL